MAYPKGYDAYLIIDKALEAGNASQAINFAKARIKNVPDDPYGPFWLGVALTHLKRYTEASISFKRALRIDEKHFASIAHLAYVKMLVCDWHELNDIIEQLYLASDADFAEGKLWFVDPYVIQPLHLSFDFQLKLAKSRAEFYNKTKPTLKLPKHFEYKKHKIKIGYLSSDFTNDAHGLLIRNLFSFHDRSRFEIFGYALRFSEGEISSLIKESCDVFHDLTFISDFEIAKKIHSEGIHILLDLRGYHERARPRILALRPAPIQCHFLGYVGTLGAPYISHYITHTDIVSENMQSLYSENIHFMPGAPFATSGFLDLEELSPAKKSDFGLSDDAFVFCCFCKPRAINEDVFHDWMEILKSVENSMLWLQSGELQVQENLYRIAESEGIEQGRIVFADSENISLTWRHRVADLWLDTYNISSKTATLLALWAGVPILTREGDLPQSRITASYCRKIGLSSLVVTSREEYINYAIDLANNSNDLLVLREQLLEQRNESSLFKPEVYVRELEDIYQSMWDQYESGG